MHHRKTRITATGYLSCKTLVLAVAIAACLPVHATAAEPATAPDTVVTFDIPAGDLSVALERFSTQSGIQAMYRQELVAGKRAPAVKGALAPAAALAKLLTGAGLASERVNARTYVLKSTAKAKPARPEPAKESEAESPLPGDVQEDRVHEMDDIVVVGSRLGSSPVESAMPIKVITRENIDRSGAGSIAQMLSYLPEIPINNGEDRQITGQTSMPSGGNTNSSTVQMRGLPRGTTLVLINGRRAGDSAAFSNGGFFDLSTIPLALVERIEVLPAGASAVYGGDALAGVINIVLRKDASGLELRVRHTSADGYGKDQASAVWGKSWSKGGLNIAASWNKGNGLWNDERALTSDMDFRRFGGSDLRSTFGSPANFYSLEGCPPSEWACSVPLEQRGNLPGMDSPVATVREGSSGVGLNPSDLVGEQSKVNTRRHLRSSERRYGVNLDGRLELTKDLEAFAELTYTQAEIPAFQMPISSFYPGQGGKWAVLEADNPLNPFGVKVGLDFVHKNTGLYRSFTNEHARGLLGLRGKTGRFDWEITGWQARDKSESSGVSSFDREKIYAAIADPNSGFNPLVADGSAPASKEVVQSLISTDVLDGMRSRISGLNAFVRGPLAQLPAGKVTALLGMESQTYTIDFGTDSSTQLVKSVHGSSTNRSLFGEARVPILSARDGQSVERLAMTGALRRETSDRFQGSALTSTVGMEFRPWESLLLRSTYSTAFRPILSYAAVQDPGELMNHVLDPKFSERYPIKLLHTGGVPEDLEPETSRTITMGMVYHPFTNWSISLTHWDIQFNNEIRAIGPDAMLENEALYSNRIFRNAKTGRIEVIDARALNISLKETMGLDVAIEGLWSTAIGDFYPSIAATYTYHFEQQLTDKAPVVSSLARYNSAGWAPRWKVIPRLAWDYRDQVRTMLVARYVSAYDDTSAFRTGPKAGTYQRLGDFWMFDLNLDVSLGRIFQNNAMLSGTNLNVGATNLFNRLPDFCNACAHSGYDASQYDIIGRTVYAEFRVNF